MTNVLRKAVVFLLFSILIVLFVISMIPGDYFRRSSGGPAAVAKIGTISITPQDFNRSYQRAIENLSARAQRRITPQQAKMLGMPERVLQSLIQQASLDYDAQNLGLKLSSDGLHGVHQRHPGVPRRFREIQPREIQQLPAAQRL